MYEFYNREIRLISLIRRLDDQKSFTTIATDILKDLNHTMKVSTLLLMQVDASNKKYVKILENGKQFKKFKDPVSFATLPMCKRYIYAANKGMAKKGEEKALEKLGLMSAMTFPIVINGVIGMYIVALSEDKILSSMEYYVAMEDAGIVLQSVAQQKVTKNSLLSSYEVLKEILGNIGSGIMVVNKNSGNILFENKIASTVAEVRETIKDCLFDIFSDDNIDDNLKRPMERYNTESGLWFEVSFSQITWIDGSDCIVATAIDITQKKKNQQKIEYQAHNDFLTGLYNRMKCETDLRRIIKKAEKDNSKGAVMFIDLDDFKHINDGLGHQYGDILLQQIAAGLTGIPGLRGHCYRMGGDEFVILITPDIFDTLEKTVTNIISLFNKPWYLMETEYFCTMSMGISIFPEHSTDVHEIVRMADVAMYEAKRTGKNGYSYYSTQKDDSSTIKQLDIEKNMRQAIATEMDEFIVFYQPVVDVNTKECKSCEALVRWDSKSLGFMAPGDFIPLAEYLGLITTIGDYVLEEACLQCKYWNEHGHPDFHINVNLSVVQLLQKDVVDIVRKILIKTGVNPKNIVLEITESFAINDMKRVLSIIEGLKQLGPLIALDDFGTGYSSLNYIKQLPLDIIKVDKTFIDDIVEDEYAQAFIRLIVELSKTIGTKIVVEGVEHEEQYELLKEIGVDFIQGFYFGKPVNPIDFDRQNLQRGVMNNEDIN